jgi:hypothetical protein
MDSVFILILFIQHFHSDSIRIAELLWNSLIQNSQLESQRGAAFIQKPAYITLLG